MCLEPKPYSFNLLDFSQMGKIHFSEHSLLINKGRLCFPRLRVSVEE